MNYSHIFLAGFAVDCVNKTIIMVEGLTNLSFPRVITHVFRLDPSKAKVLYNSELLFTKVINFNVIKVVPI